MIKRSLSTLTIVALSVGVSATAARAAGDATPTLRAEVDAIGARYFAAEAQASALDQEMHSLDRRLAQSRRHTAMLRPAARARALQLYQATTTGFAALFDTTSAMESARRAELIARASDRTQALLDEYASSAAVVQRQRAQISRARAAQAVVVAGLAKQEAALERALAQAQQAYRDRLAAQASAALAAANAARSQPIPVRSGPTAAPPAPVPIAPPPPPAAGANPHHDDPFLVCTRTRESSGNYGAVNSGGYYGAYQFSQPTWDVTASHAGSPQLIGVRPDHASPWDQDQLAWVLHEWEGNAPWGGLC